MIFRFVRGNNNKYFVYIEGITTSNDIQLFDIIKKTLYRSEYNPFVKGTFSKTLEYSYLFNNYIFPYQFWGDVKTQCEKVKNVLIPEENIKLINDPYESGLFKYIDRISFDNWLKTISPPKTILLDDENYKYQQDAVFNALNSPTSRIEIATAGGKTFITYMYCRFIIEHNEELELNSDSIKILIVVPSQLLCTQLKRDFDEYNVNNKTSKIIVETIYSNSKKVANANVVCGTYQSLREYEPGYFDDFSVFICDELHRAKSYSIRNGIYCKMKNLKYILGMTGSFPEYKKLDYLHIVSMFGSNVMNIKSKDLIEKGVANKVKIKRLKLHYYDDYNVSHKHISDLIDLSVIDENDEYFGKKKYMLEKDYFQHNTSRIKLISQLLNRFLENSIIFVDTVEYCNTLYDYLTKANPNIRFDIIHGKIKNREEILENFRNTKDHNVIIATYGTMSTGISIKSLTNAYIVDSGKSQIRIKQSIGRLMRLMNDKHESIVFDFYDDIYGSSFKNHSIERYKTYQNEGLDIEEFVINLHV